MDIPSHAQVVEQIDAFLHRHGMAVTRLGREVADDPNLVASIRRGREPSLSLLRKLATFMAERDDELVLVEDASNSIDDDHSASDRALHRLSTRAR